MQLKGRYVCAQPFDVVTVYRSGISTVQHRVERFGLGGITVSQSTDLGFRLCNSSGHLLGFLNRDVTVYRSGISTVQPLRDQQAVSLVIGSQSTDLGFRLCNMVNIREGERASIVSQSTDLGFRLCNRVLAGVVSSLAGVTVYRSGISTVQPDWFCAPAQVIWQPDNLWRPSATILRSAVLINSLIRTHGLPRRAATRSLRGIRREFRHSHMQLLSCTATQKIGPREA